MTFFGSFSYQLASCSNAIEQQVPVATWVRLSLGNFLALSRGE